MNEWERLHQQAKRYQAEYPPGTRIMLLSRGRDPCPVEDQTRGTVKVVDDIGTLHCSFDNGRSLGVVPGEDSFRMKRIWRRQSCASLTLQTQLCSPVSCVASLQRKHRSKKLWSMVVPSGEQSLPTATFLAHCSKTAVWNIQAGRIVA